MEKDFLHSLPVSGLAQPLSPRGLPISPFPFFSLLRPSVSSAHLAAQEDSQRAPPLPFATVADKAVPRSSATARGDPLVGLIFYLESGSDTSRIATVRAIRARSPDFARFPSFKYRPEAPLAPQSIPSRSHHVEFAKAAAKIRAVTQSAAAVRPEPREQLAGLPATFAKSPKPSLPDFVLSVPR